MLYKYKFSQSSGTFPPNVKFHEVRVVSFINIIIINTAVNRKLRLWVQTLTNDRIQACISQILPTKRRINCVRVNVVGSSGVGKTSLIEALQCGYVRSLFRRSGAAALLSAVTRRTARPSTGNTTLHADHKKSNGMFRHLVCVSMYVCMYV